MNTITKQLADALRAVTGTPPRADYSGKPDPFGVYAALAAYDAFMLGVAEAHSDVTTHVGPDMIEAYDEGRASVRGTED